jgi:hypothetical protein
MSNNRSGLRRVSGGQSSTPLIGTFLRFSSVANSGSNRSWSGGPSRPLARMRINAAGEGTRVSILGQLDSGR